MRKPVRRAFLVWVLVAITPPLAQMTPATATVHAEKVFVQDSNRANGVGRRGGNGASSKVTFVVAIGTTYSTSDDSDGDWIY
jgi:hypothetical protein